MKRMTWRLLLIPALFIGLAVGNWVGMLVMLLGMLVIRSEFVK